MVYPALFTVLEPELMLELLWLGGSALRHLARALHKAFVPEKQGSKICLGSMILLYFGSGWPS